MNFEEQLRQAMKPQDPGEDFTRAVLARVRRTQPSRTRWLAPLALAASLVLAAGGALEYQNYRARKAKADLEFALQITGSKLQYVQEKLAAMNR